MRFEWDPAKHRKSLAERGIGFDFAARILEGDVVEWVDTRRDYGETRFIALGEVEGEWLVVFYTWRGDARRIISARRAGRKERP